MILIRIFQIFRTLGIRRTLMNAVMCDHFRESYERYERFERFLVGELGQYAMEVLVDKFHKMEASRCQSNS